MDRVLHAWIICFASLACLSSSFWTQADKHRLQTKLMGGFTVAIKHVPLINGRLEDFPALLHLPIHSEYFPFFKKRVIFLYWLYCSQKIKKQAGVPITPSPLLVCTNIVLCELATCFDRLVSQRMCREMQHVWWDTQLSSQIKFVWYFNLLSVDK